jgi:GT2 family glycosyltransferase
MASALPGLSVVIPTYNAIGQVEGLLRQLLGLREQAAYELQIIVADDASPDGTAQTLAAHFPDIDVVAGERNLGFGGNVMRGVEQARLPSLAALNSDVELLGEPFSALLAQLRQEPRCFAAMPLIYNTGRQLVENFAELYGKRGLVWHRDRPQGREWSELLADLLVTAKQPAERLAALAAGRPAIRSLLCGAVFVCRSAEFRSLGGFDARYQPYYWEDVDLDYRARLRGQHCVVVPQAAVLHRHSETIDRLAGDRKIHHLRRNQLRFVAAHLRQLETGPERISQARAWWWLRGLRESCGGDKELARAYFAAAAGRSGV